MEKQESSIQSTAAEELTLGGQGRGRGTTFQGQKRHLQMRLRRSSQVGGTNTRRVLRKTGRSVSGSQARQQRLKVASGRGKEGQDEI